MFFVNVNGVKVGYMRISTSDGKQCLDLQETALIEAGVSPNKIYSDMESGAKEDRPGFMYMVKALNPGDTVVVWAIDRLGRNTKQLVVTVDDFKKRGIKLEILSGVCKGIDLSTQIGMFFYNVMAVFAQLEREFICGRVKAGIASAKKRGLRFGRKFKLSKTEIDTIQYMIKSGVPKAEIARRFEITKQTVHNYFTPEGEIKQRG